MDDFSSLSAEPAPAETDLAPARDDAVSAIRGFVVTTFRDGWGQGITATTPLVTSGIVDSAGVLELVDFLERRFAIRIADEDVTLDHFNTLAALAALVAARRR